MNTNKTTRLLSALALTWAFLALPLAASAQPSHGAMQGGAAAGGSAAGGMDMMSMMKDTNQKMMSMPMTGDPDIDFAMMMRMHHMSAVQMSEVELRDGKDAKTRGMAKKIIASQKKEIREFEQFLSKHGHPVEKMVK